MIKSSAVTRNFSLKDSALPIARQFLGKRYFILSFVKILIFLSNSPYNLLFFRKRFGYLEVAIATIAKPTKITPKIIEI
jgi:hypothetical protein